MTKNNSYKYLLLIIAILITLPVFASTDDTVEIVAIGYGNTLEEATDNAIKHSLELATGILVRSYSSLDSSLTIDASGLVYTEEFKENILTFSRAYIKDYEITSISELSGMVEITIIANVRLRALEATMLRNRIGVKDFQGDKLLALFEANTQTVENAAKLTESILNDFDTPKGFWRIGEITTAIVSTDDENAVLEVTVDLEPDVESFKGLINELSEILDMVASKQITQAMKLEQADSWLRVELSSLINDQDCRYVVRVLEERNDRKISLKTYFFSAKDDIEYSVWEQFKRHVDSIRSYEFLLTLKDEMGSILFSSDLKNLAQGGLLLNAPGLGMIYTGQKSNQVIIAPAPLYIEPGVLKINVQPQRLVWRITLNKELLKKAKKISVDF
ncbi:MAG TPA: hypothetical protein PK411_14260 [Mesotoga infera]|uniref:Flagellar assembly protein T N-terminal domain-containing protein n=1 Tax=Mesotoga infera TaxID=1236046 RepID=A0A7Z7PQG6_9BACT|nr:hypothetical protein [Mesotoga infera]SSC12407.1 exported protein of unknown function [Mesotoga infera]HPD39506.1 hypothetical protein [Mesotoga infera]HRV03130.1 hypothetical protein [Mesotoga sp.]